MGYYFIPFHDAQFDHVVLGDDNPFGMYFRNGENFENPYFFGNSNSVRSIICCVFPVGGTVKILLGGNWLKSLQELPPDQAAGHALGFCQGRAKRLCS
jgi:hypothetical protein